MKIDLQSPEVQFALEAVGFASELAYRIRSEAPIKIIIKPDHSPVTLADLGIQAIVGGLLAQYFPGSSFLAEESADIFQEVGGGANLDKVTGLVHSFLPQATPGKVCAWIDRGKGPLKKSFWTLDPIDGTKGFLRGGQYATALALIRDGKVVLAALGCPVLDLPAHYGLGKGVGILALKDQGCWAAAFEDLEDPRRWVRLKVSQCQDITQARILDSFDLGHKDLEKNQQIKNLLGIIPEIISLDSMAKHGLLAAGGAEIFFRTLPVTKPAFREKIWDVAAGVLAIEEAGGRVTDLEGKLLDFSTGSTLAHNPGFLATNGVFHDAVLETLQKVTAA
ncbi:MAG TPA: inositol monophosphatase family protein [Candidatus Omnitrophota bacterium]|nr:inositol monophosphatase family protein [Candidatus Omnitrophota bacterium]